MAMEKHFMSDFSDVKWVFRGLRPLKHPENKNEICVIERELASEDDSELRSLIRLKPKASADGTHMLTG